MTHNFLEMMDPDGGASIEERNAIIVKMYSQKKSHKEIAKFVGISRPRVSQILRDIRAAWRETYMDSFNVVINEQLAKIDAIEAELWEGWERSKQFRRSIINKKGEERGEWTDVKQQEFQVNRDNDLAEPPGDPKFLAQVQSCIDQRAKLLGLYASEVRQKEKQDKKNKMMEEMVEALMAGTLNPEAVKAHFPDLAADIFQLAGRDINGNLT